MTNAILVMRKLLNSSHIKRSSNVQERGDAAVTMNSSSNGRHNSSSGSNGRANEVVEPSADALLPRYLFPLVRHYHDDFYVSRSFEPRLIVQLMAEGFLPIATSGYLLPKLHVERCVLQLNPQSNLHISKSTRKKSKRFLLSLNECFDEVVAGCHRQHGINWLYPPIVAAFRAIHERTKDGNSGVVNAIIMSDNPSPGPHDVTPVRLYSVEVWNAETGVLAGGELGYSVGSIYSSLTGFSNEDAAGSVQLVALGKLLTRCGFEYWDLGMNLEYKRRLGAGLMRRVEFVNTVKRSRVDNKGVVLQCDGERKNAKEIVDWGRPSAAMDTDQNGGKSKQKKKSVELQPPLGGEIFQEPNRKKPHKEPEGT